MSLKVYAAAGNTELARFSSIAMESASELEYQFLLAYDLGFMSEGDYTDLSNRVIAVK